MKSVFMTAWTFKKGEKTMTERITITAAELMKMREELTPLNRLKFDLKYYESLDQENQLTKEDLIEFAKAYQVRSSELSMSYEDLALFGTAFERLGQKFGVLDEFHENGIC